MNFKKDDIIISEYNTLGVFEETRGSLYVSKYCIGGDPIRFQYYLQLKNPRLATKSEIKEYLYLLKRLGRYAELNIVRKIIFKDEY